MSADSGISCVEDYAYPRRKERLMAEVVVGVDGSEGSNEAVRWALAEAALRGATLRLVCVYQTPAAWLGMGEALGSAVTATVSDEDLRNYAEETISAALEAIGGAGDVQTVPDARPGHPADALIEASRDADLLVLGSRGHGEFGSVLLGSVSTHCTHHASCPVTVIPHQRHHRRR